MNKILFAACLVLAILCGWLYLKSRKVEGEKAVIQKRIELIEAEKSRWLEIQLQRIVVMDSLTKRVKTLEADTQKVHEKYIKIRANVADLPDDEQLLFLSEQLSSIK